MTTKLSKPTEVWHQDHNNQDLWHNDNKLIINTAALNERDIYFELLRIPSTSPMSLEAVSSSDFPSH